MKLVLHISFMYLQVSVYRYIISQQQKQKYDKYFIMKNRNVKRNSVLTGKIRRLFQKIKQGRKSAKYNQNKIFTTQ